MSKPVLIVGGGPAGLAAALIVCGILTGGAIHYG